VLEAIVEKTGVEGTPILSVDGASLAEWLKGQPERTAGWVAASGFSAKPGSVCQVPGDDGRVRIVLFGADGDQPLWNWGGLPGKLPDGLYRVDPGVAADEAEAAALGWVLGAYRFDRYKSKKDETAVKLVWPDGCDRGRVERLAEATFLVRDLINTPANEMGPEELAAAARAVAERFGADYAEVTGEDLLAQNYPAIHAVGAGSPRAPRLIDIRWGAADAPKVTLVGKGVCFDTGGLDIKPAAGMKLMKKDMGGAAHVLGIASAVMAAALPVRLRVLIPAVENSVSGRAMRPSDVIRTRKGLTAEVANTDAEGRLVLADALAEAATEAPEAIVDFATLTGAARVALGPDLPALFASDDGLADGLLKAGAAAGDPLWRLPLFAAYRKRIDSKIADLNNAPDGPYAGAITAALFLQEFVEPEIPWAHVDLMAWNTDSKPGRPEGGEAMGLRAVYTWLESRYHS